MKKRDGATPLTSNQFDDTPQERGLRILGKIIARKFISQHNNDTDEARNPKPGDSPSFRKDS